jgi:hypothetical protein
MPETISGVVLVEGPSDQAAVLALAARLGRDLTAEGIEMVDLGGITNVGRALRRYGPQGEGVRVAGLYDAAEEHAVAAGLRRAGMASGRVDRTMIEHLGLFACDRDLEDELIRAVGPDDVCRVIDDENESRPWQTFQQQPAQAGRPVEARLRRFIGTKSGRKIRYGRLLVEALDLDRVPAPLALLMAAL